MAVCAFEPAEPFRIRIEFVLPVVNLRLWQP